MSYVGPTEFGGIQVIPTFSDGSFKESPADYKRRTGANYHWRTLAHKHKQLTEQGHPDAEDYNPFRHYTEEEIPELAPMHYGVSASFKAHEFKPGHNHH